MQVAAQASTGVNMYFPRYDLKNVIYDPFSREQKLTISSKLESTHEPGEVNATKSHYEPNTNKKQPWDHLSPKSRHFRIKRCRSRFGSDDAWNNAPIAYTKRDVTWFSRYEVDRRRSKTYKLTALLNETRDQAKDAKNQARDAENQAKEAENQGRGAEYQAREAKIQAEEAVAARQDAEREVIRLHSIIRNFQIKPAMPPTLNFTAHNLQQKSSPILLPFTPQMHDPSLKSSFDPQVATARSTEAQHQYFPSFNSLGSKSLASSACLDAYTPALSPFVNLDLRAPFLYDQSADISAMPSYGPYPSPTFSLQDVESGHRARYFVDRSADVPEVSSHYPNSFLTLDMEIPEPKQQAPYFHGSSAERPLTNSQSEAVQTVCLLSHMFGTINSGLDFIVICPRTRPLEHSSSQIEHLQIL